MLFHLGPRVASASPVSSLVRRTWKNLPSQHRNQPAQRHRMAKQLLATVALAATASANDPAGSWLSYAAYTDPGHGIITALNTTWKVPSNPASNWGSNAPG